MTLRVVDTLEVRRWLLGLVPEAEVLAPPTLREATRRQVEALAHKLEPRRPLPGAIVNAPTPEPGPSLLARSVTRRS